MRNKWLDLERGGWGWHHVRSNCANSAQLKEKLVMLVMIAGPVSAESDKLRMENTAKLNRVAAEVLKLGHIPLVGVNAAVPVVEEAGVADKYETTMTICEALAERCDAILLIGESRGACRERDVLQRCGRPVFHDLNELPPS